MIRIGQRVSVAKVQKILGKPKFPGRVGVVIRRNLIAKDDHGGLWYVLLDATSRAKAREESFWGDMLDIAEVV